jgi:hypothetical protein
MEKDGNILDFNETRISKLDFVAEFSKSSEFHFLPEEIKGKIESIAIFG